MAKRTKPIVLTFRMSDEDVALIEQAAEALGVSRSQFLRQAIEKETLQILGSQNPPPTLAGKLSALLGDRLAG